MSKVRDLRKIFYVGQQGVQLRRDGITAGELRVEPFRCVEFVLHLQQPLFCCRQVQNSCFLLIFMIHECQADHIGNFPLRLVIRQQLQFLRADNIAVRREHTGFVLAHLFADFGVIQKGIDTVRQSIQIIPKAVFYIKFSECFVRMDICKHMTTIHVGSQHHQLRYGNDSAVFLHMILDLHLQETFHRCFLIVIQLTELLCQGTELEDRHIFVQMGRKVVKAVEFIHLPIHVPR